MTPRNDGGTNMTTTDDVTTHSPSILMIEGREYALYQGFMERVKIVDVKLLWLNAARMWALILYAVVSVAAVFLIDSTFSYALWALTAVVTFGATGTYMDNRSVLNTPVSAVEKHRSGRAATLSLSTRSLLVFSTRPSVTLTTEAHPHMADFLLGVLSPDHARGFTRRPHIPADLRKPKVRRYMWGSSADRFVQIGAWVVLVALLVRIFTR